MYGKSNCGCGTRKGLCPVSFGLALGITSALAVLIWSFWVMHGGMSPMMTAAHMAMPTVAGAFIHAGWALLKGFVFGFFLALFYDLISCCCTARCCRKSDCVCECCVSSDERKRRK